METEFVRWLRDRLPAHRCLRLGIGDDAAILAVSSPGELVATTDMLVDGVHFRLEADDPRRIGHKALGANLSDLAAMAAEPVAALISLAIPRGGASGTSAMNLAVAIVEGTLPLAERFDVVLAGGDTNTWDGPLVINVAAYGTVGTGGPLTRSGGRPGDRLLVTGSFGGSSLGRHLEVAPRVAEARLLRERYELHAGIDVSDGLALDLSRLAESSGCGAIVSVDHVPIADAAHQLGQTAADALRHALGDGEDFELLLAVPPEAAQRIVGDQPLDCPVTDIGELTSQPGLRQRNAAGETSPLEPTGYVHRGSP